MKESLPYLMEDPKKPYKLAKDHQYYPRKAKGMSFFAFIFSIFVYISIFYIFNLSPSTLFKTSKFWFLISNTLILIIAVDYGSFSSSKNKHHDVYNEYLSHSTEPRRVTNTISSSDYEEIIVKQSHVVDEQKRQDSEEEYLYMQKEEKETERSDTTTTTNNNNNKIPEKPLLQIVVNQGQQDEDIQEKNIVHVDIDKKVSETNKVDFEQPIRRTYRRSKSEMPKKVVCGEAKKNVISRSTTTKNREKFNDHIEEMNEFSTMSDEDLNRRVEEFIQRFNRQIRLQAREDIIREK